MDSMPTELTQATQNEGEVLLQILGECAFIRLGSDSEKISVLTNRRLKSFEAALNKIKSNNALKGLIISAPRGGSFCGGADINVINVLSDAHEGEALAKQGQSIFQLLEDLPFTTVAAINGPCVGGGCELALACDYRVLVDDSKTKIGLPEIKLGILPGFGGTQRLPRLIGLPRALDIILNGKILSAAQAKSIGLADRLVASGTAPEDLAKKIILNEISIERKSPKFLDQLLTKTLPGRALVASKVKSKVLKQTKGNYPAPLRALDVVLAGLSKGLVVGYEQEAKALGELIISSECKSLIHIYFVGEASQKLGRGLIEDFGKTKIAVVGAGVMGMGIAASFLTKGANVVLVDPFEQARAKALKHIEDSISKRKSSNQKDKASVLSRLVITDKMQEAAGSKIIIEAALEDLELKKKIFTEAREVLGDDAILATNTSSLSIEKIASQTKGEETVVGMHFFNPPEKMPLVEVVRSKTTSEKTMLQTAALAARLGKYPVIVEDVTGFLVNRVLSPYMVEAAILLSQGYSERDIDKAAVDFGMPMGPLRLTDEVGLDIAAKVASMMVEAYGKRMEGPKFAETLLNLGRKGKKTGQGFYNYPEREAVIDPELRSILKLQDAKEILESKDREMLQKRLVLRLVNEAVLCLDEGVAGFPGPEAAGQIDLASVMGIGFAPFRGGIIRYAEMFGSHNIYKSLCELAETEGKRYEPCKGVVIRAQDNRSFYQAL